MYRRVESYVSTPVVTMSAPIVASSTCHRATIKAQGMQVVSRHTPTSPKGAYMPTTSVGTHAPPSGLFYFLALCVITYKLEIIDCLLGEARCAYALPIGVGVTLAEVTSNMKNAPAMPIDFRVPLGLLRRKAVTDHPVPQLSVSPAKPSRVHHHNDVVEIIPRSRMRTLKVDKPAEQSVNRFG